jgi:hypothetical protein
MLISLYKIARRKRSLHKRKILKNLRKPITMRIKNNWKRSKKKKKPEFMDVIIIMY